MQREEEMRYMTYGFTFEFFFENRVVIYYGTSMLECYRSLKQAWRCSSQLRKYRFPLMAITKEHFVNQWEWQIKVKPYRII